MTNEKTSMFKSLLGIGNKPEGQSHLIDDTVEFVPPVDNSGGINYLELELTAEQKEDPAGYAANLLEEFTLTRGAKSLLDRALDNLSRNTGANIADPDAKLDIKLRAELIQASGNDLNILIEALTEEAPIESAGGVVYSMLFNVLKAATFEANLDYRRFLDPAADFELVAYIDRREDTSPLEGQTGHATRVEVMLEQARELYGRDVHDVEDIIPSALSDLRYFLQLLSESFGWDPLRPMPFLFVTELNGSFTPINDPMQALDTQELRRQAARAKKRDATNKLMGAAATRARAALSKAAAKQA